MTYFHNVTNFIKNPTNGIHCTMINNETTRNNCQIKLLSPDARALLQKWYS